MQQSGSCARRSGWRRSVRLRATCFSGLLTLTFALCAPSYSASKKEAQETLAAFHRAVWEASQALQVEVPLVQPKAGLEFPAVVVVPHRSTKSPAVIYISDRFLESGSQGAIRYVAWHEVAHVKLDHRGRKTSQENAVEYLLWKEWSGYRRARIAYNNWSLIYNPPSRGSRPAAPAIGSGRGW